MPELWRVPDSQSGWSGYTLASYTDGSIPPTLPQPSGPTEDSVEGRMLGLSRNLGRYEVVSKIRYIMGSATCPKSRTTPSRSGAPPERGINRGNYWKWMTVKGSIEARLDLAPPAKTRHHGQNPDGYNDADD